MNVKTRTYFLNGESNMALHRQLHRRLDGIYIRFYAAEPRDAQRWRDIEVAYFLVEFLDSLVARCSCAESLLVYHGQTAGRKSVLPGSN